MTGAHAGTVDLSPNGGFALQAWLKKRKSWGPNFVTHNLPTLHQKLDGGSRNTDGPGVTGSSGPR